MYRVDPSRLNKTSTKHTFDLALVDEVNQMYEKGEAPKQLEKFPALECPKCERMCRPQRVNKDGSVSYSCPPDHEKHGNRYTWRIAEDGSLID